MIVDICTYELGTYIDMYISYMYIEMTPQFDFFATCICVDSDQSEIIELQLFKLLDLGLFSTRIPRSIETINGGRKSRMVIYYITKTKSFFF